MNSCREGHPAVMERGADSHSHLGFAFTVGPLSSSVSSSAKWYFYSIFQDFLCMTIKWYRLGWTKRAVQCLTQRRWLVSVRWFGGGPHGDWIPLTFHVRTLGHHTSVIVVFSPSATLGFSAHLLSLKNG